MDLSRIYQAYERRDGRGLAAYHPLMLTRVLLYAYATGMRSSRRIEKATYDDLAFRYLSADQHPDHDTIAAFRQQHLAALGSLFAQALQLCQRAGLVKLGVLAIDGTKIRANASGRHSLRYEALRAEEQRLQKMVERLLREAAQTDAEEDARWGKGQPADPLPAGLSKAEERLRRIREAKQALEQEVQQQLAEAEAACPKGKPGRPRKDAAPKPESLDKQKRKNELKRARLAAAGQTRHYNFTDPDSRMMHDNGIKRVVQGYNAQLAVDAHAHIIVAAQVSQDALDKRQLLPMTKAAKAAMGGVPDTLLADTGYWNYASLADPLLTGIDVLVPPDAQGGAGRSRLRADHPLVQAMRGKLKTDAGRRKYRLRQVIVEPVLAHIKEHRWFRRFSLRGLEQVQGEWNLICLTHNLLKLFRRRTQLPQMAV